MSFLPVIGRDNDALRTNPPNANRHLSTHSSDWLWAVTAVFALTFLSWLIWSFILKGAGQARRNQKTSNGGGAVLHTSQTRDPERIFHYLWTVAAFAGLIAYFSMASDLGNTPVRQYLHHGNNPNQTRQIFYARYIYWFVAWPMVIIASLLLSGVSWATILFAIVIQEFWVITWLCGALIASSYKWGYYAFGIVAYFILAAILLYWGRSYSVRISSKHYTPLVGTLVLVWALYIIAWGLSEGSNRLSVTGEMVFYGILDLISVPLFGFAFLALSRSWDQGVLGLHYTQGRIGRPDATESEMVVGRNPELHEGIHNGFQNGAQNGVYNGEAPHTIV